MLQTLIRKLRRSQDHLAAATAREQLRRKAWHAAFAEVARWRTQINADRRAIDEHVDGLVAESREEDSK